jgi:G3E family GTPase
MPEPLSHIPATIVTGFLGVGKTTAILDLFRYRPEGQRWAVLVNEFGDVGIDGATYEDGGIAVREIPGGCICCTAGVELRVGLVRLLRDVRPDRLLIEPTGAAHPASVVDALRSLGEAVDPRATIGLVDPVAFCDPRWAAHEAYADQVRIADVLVANRCDHATPAQIAAFEAAAAALWPPKLVIATTTDGRLDPAWLELRPSAAEVVHTHVHDVDDAAGKGWIWPADASFRRDALEKVLQTLVRPNAGLPAGVLRLKGIFRTERQFLRVDASSDQIRWQGIGWRRDSRVEVIAPAAPPPDWTQVEAAFRSALI